MSEAATAPERRCDVVMKGGITSGIVYPLAVAQLSEKYRFASIGGTSAGAVAAAATAAAEYGRRQGRDGFGVMRDLPGRLGTEDGETQSNLFRLFHPTAETRPLYRVFVQALSFPAPYSIIEALLEAIAQKRRWATLGGLLGFVLFAGVDLFVAPQAAWWETFPLLLLLLLSVAVMLVGALAGALVRLGFASAAAIKKNHFGVCSGYDKEFDDPEADGDQIPVPEGGEPLTIWLANLIDEAAGRSRARPLTFADLWGEDVYNKQISLQMLTTCLTLGRPFPIPFADDPRLYFKPKEWRELFPARILKAIDPDWQGKEYVPLPGEGKLPIVVGARLSLSFPILLSAIPLYRDDPRQPGTMQQLRFSDGGICSNFPLTFFDSPFPRWPTFGINLAPDVGDGEMTWLPRTNTEPEPEPRHKVESVFGLLAAIRDSMQNWNDNAHAALPGYRDRIVAIRFKDREGGLNLNMPDERIRELSGRGRQAGEMLGQRFTTPWDARGGPELSWDNHRWLRLRTALPALELFVQKILRGWESNEKLLELFPSYKPSPPVAGERSYGELLAAASGESYARLDAQQRALAEEVTKQLIASGELWITTRGNDSPSPASPSLIPDQPLPAPILRVTPPL